MTNLPMGNPPAEPFADNWAYIKTELNWLERLLMVAVGQQRRDLQETASLAQTTRDQVTRHWWKGVISLNQNPNYDEMRPTPPPTGDAALGYQQQLSQRIQESQTQGVLLLLPSLQERLQLTPFEKQLLLLGLAPEVNRRYTKLYNYLQGENRDRPLLDLALKLFCRTDQDWQAARSRLVENCPLLQQGLVQLLGTSRQPLLLHSVRLRDDLVNGLLAHTVTGQQLEQMLRSTPPPAPPLALVPADGFLPGVATPGVATPGISAPGVATSPAFAPAESVPGSRVSPSPVPPASALWPRTQPSGNPWAPLILPNYLHQSLQTLSDSYRWRLTAAVDGSGASRSGEVMLWTGAAGTGKTLAAQTLALTMGVDLVVVDLAQMAVSSPLALVEQLRDRPPVPDVLVLQPARLWLGWKSPLPTPLVKALFQERCAQGLLTLVIGQQPFPLAWPWQSQVQRHWQFPRPDVGARQRIWQQIFPLTVNLDPALPWSTIAQRWEITGGDIEAIAQTAQAIAQESSSPLITLGHVEQAWLAQPRSPQSLMS
ncbi:ATP-binding protein [Prochlorothrix hollandica]|nr:hypothetical protein [Prochlorothrix hollandica]